MQKKIMMLQVSKVAFKRVLAFWTVLFAHFHISFESNLM